MSQFLVLFYILIINKIYNKSIIYSKKLFKYKFLKEEKNEKKIKVFSSKMFPLNTL